MRGVGGGIDLQLAANRIRILPRIGDHVLEPDKCCALADLRITRAIEELPVMRALCDERSRQPVLPVGRLRMMPPLLRYPNPQRANCIERVAHDPEQSSVRRSLEKAIERKGQARPCRVTIAFAWNLERLRQAIVGGKNYVERWLAPIYISIEAVEKLAEDRCAASAATQDHDRWCARHARTLSSGSAARNGGVRAAART